MAVLCTNFSLIYIVKIDTIRNQIDIFFAIKIIKLWCYNEKALGILGRKFIFMYALSNNGINNHLIIFKVGI